MPLEITEKEMLSRFTDALKQSASAAKELAEPMNEKQPKALHDFIHGLKVAAGSTHQLGIYRENLSLLDVRDILEQVIDASQSMVAASISGSPYWVSIQDFLKNMSEQGVKMAESKAMSRQDVLANLVLRAKNNKHLN